MDAKQSNPGDRVPSKIEAGGAGYREFIDRAPLAVLLVDGRGNIRDNNAAALALLGYSQEELLTLHITHLVPEEGAAAAAEGFAQLRAEGRRQTDLFLLRKDGSRICAELNASRVGDDLYMGFLEDVTLKREAEQELRLRESRFRAILESNLDGFTLADASGKLLEVNTAFAHMLGYQPQELIGLHASQVSHDLDAEALASWFGMNRDKGTVDVQVQMRCKDGSVRPVEMRSTYLPVDGGMYAGFCRDIRRRMRSEALLRIRLRLSLLVEEVELDVLMQSALDEAEHHTGSTIGFYHFVDEDQENLTLTAWSTNTLMKLCTAEGKHSHYPISMAGVWVDAFHSRRAVIHNDYQSLSHRKGLPKGHAMVHRELVVPVMRGEQVRAILGVGNKESAYNEDDATFLEELASIIYDLVERKRAENALADSERRHRQMVETASEGIWSMDADGLTIFVNPAICRLLGYTAEEMAGRSMLDFMDPGEHADHLAQMQARRQGRESTYERTLLRKNGGRCVCKVSATPLYAEDGHFSGSFGLFTDISAQRNAEDALQATVRFSRSILNSLSAHVAVLDRDGQILEVNEAWRHFALENGANDLVGVGIGTNYFEVCGKVKDDVGAGEAAKGIRDVMEGRLGEFQMEYPCHSESEDRWFQLRVLPLKDSQGRVVVAHENITFRRQFEHQLASERERMDMIIRAANVGTWEWKVQTGEAIFNERWAEILGYTLAEIEPVSIDTWTRFAHPDDLKHSSALLARHFAGEDRFYECVARMQHRDGNWVWVLDRGRVTKWAQDGRPLLMQGTHTDVTEMKQLEEVQSFLARSHSGQGEATFFNSLALFLSQAFGADQVDILRVDTVKGRVREVAVWKSDGFGELESYALDGSLAAKLLDMDELVLGPQEIQNLPDYAALREEKVKSYVGLALHGHNGRVIGSILVSSRRLNSRPALTLTLLRLAGVRAAAEMERLASEKALKERSERYELVLAGSQSAIWDWDMQRHSVLYSSQWKVLHGFGPDEDVGHSEDLWGQCIHPDDYNRVMGAVEAHMEGRSAVFAEEYRILRQNGDWRWIADRGIAMRDSHGRVLRLAGSEVDITERKLAEEAMQEHALILQARNEELARFNRVAVGRELRMIELKKEVNALCQEMGRPCPYKAMAADELTRTGSSTGSSSNSGS